MGTLLQILGAVTITISLGLIWLPLGVFTGGFMMVLFGVAIGRNRA